MWQSNGSMLAKEGSSGGDQPGEDGGESDDDQWGEADLQLQRNTLCSTSPWQPQVQEARAHHLLVRHSQLQTRSEKESSAPCACPWQTISGRWYWGLSLSQCLHQGSTKVVIFLSKFLLLNQSPQTKAEPWDRQTFACYKWERGITAGLYFPCPTYQININTR